MRRDVFQAIADPNRRAIIGLLAANKLRLNDVAEKFDISRPAVSKHIKILSECGLVTVTLQGREHYCEANLKKLDEVTDWVNHFKVFWNNKLDALEEFLEQPEKPVESTKPIKSNLKKS